MDERQRGDGWWVTTFVIGIVALVMGVVAIALASGDDNPGSAAGAGGGSGGATTANGGQVEFDVMLADISVMPNSIEVPAGALITLHVTNNGQLDHDLKVEGGDTGTTRLKSGESQDVEVGPFTADTAIWCTVAGHKEAGMNIAVHVVGGSAASGGGAATTAPADQSAQIDAAAMPDDTWEGRDPVLPPALTGTVHEIAFDAIEQEIEVAPGVTQLMWTFNGSVPGPTLHGKIGDTFRITLTNRGTMGHSIDFHASKVAWNDEMRTIQPGESLVYEFQAQFAGAYMYHCGTAPALHHIGNGMFGAIIIDPPNLAPVDEEFVIVQSELYLGPDGQPGDLTKMINEDWDAVVFNGYFAQYKFRPIHVEAGKRYRLWVIDDGPNENSSFHIVGTIFDTVFKEGAYLLQPDDTHGGSQALDLQPAQGGFVEFTFAEDGLYPFVTHKFANPGKGALGFFAVGDVDTSALGGH
ncbi:MAG TPA: multicopper oxidase domain-containing protein [Ilumatobacteraceae bacterium]|nr:multicopper oxidase domain-containing protein [Ilumatobacteraceae bacterium]